MIRTYSMMAWPLLVAAMIFLHGFHGRYPVFGMLAIVEIGKMGGNGI
jgi:hypothetical protein